MYFCWANSNIFTSFCFDQLDFYGYIIKHVKVQSDGIVRFLRSRFLRGLDQSPIISTICRCDLCGHMHTRPL